MTAAPISVASAVVLPGESEIQVEPTSPPQKRRHSSESTPTAKRRRTSNESLSEEPSRPVNGASLPLHGDSIDDRRRHGQMEERKRGKRLFGALLGTLSQSSSSTAQKRRADIENKQRNKLKMQTEEENERRQVQFAELNERRQEEQKVFDRQSLKMKHSNLLAQAHFLQTKSQPVLFYKPWELRADEEELIKTQIAEARRAVENERGIPEDRKPPDHEESALEQNMDQDFEHARAQNGKNPANGGSSGDANADDAEQAQVELHEGGRSAEHEEKVKDNPDDGEEVHGDEDTVIY